MSLNAECLKIYLVKVEEVCIHCRQKVNIAILRKHIQRCRWERLKLHV